MEVTITTSSPLELERLDFCVKIRVTTAQLSSS